MHRNSPFDPYLTRMRNEIETQSLRAQIHAHMTKDSPQFRRTRRFAQLIQYLLADFLPHDRDCRRRIEEHLIEVAFAGNCEIINVPPECDELDKLQLERRMLDMKAAPILSSEAVTPVAPCSAATEPVTRYGEPAIPHAIKAIMAWQANKATSYTPTDILNDCGDAILAALTAAEPQTSGMWQIIETAPKDGRTIIIVKADAEEPDACVAHFRNGNWACMTAEDWDAGSDETRDLAWYLNDATHWMPRPIAPPLSRPGRQS